MWRGTGQRADVEGSAIPIGVQIAFAHDGHDFVSYEQRIWRDADASVPLARESGFWRRGFSQDAVEVVVAYPSGGLAVLTGIVGDARYELASDVRASSPTGVQPDGERRLYAVVRDQLMVVAERHDGATWQPLLTASLARVRS